MINLKNKGENGITLIALIVTVIVLIILAGVSISMLTGENGIITKAKLAQQMTETTNEKEAIQLNIALANMEKKLDSTNRYLIGETLLDRTFENADKWNIVIDNQTLKQYGTGYNYVAKGTDILNYGKAQYDWLVDYNSGEIIQLGSEYTSLSYKSSLAVTDNLILNIDATNLDNDNWGDIVKHGDVMYSSENSSLYFDGDGDYLELTRNADFSNGFTFEIYANLERLEYNNGRNEPDSLGLFCKMPSLYKGLTKSMRFGYCKSNKMICRFGDSYSWEGKGDKLFTKVGMVCSLERGYDKNEDFYLTFIYRRYDETNPQWNEKADRVEYYINGSLYGYTYHGIDSYNKGCEVWNTNDSHFYLGVCPYWSTGSLYYLKGNVYCARLYEKALSSDEVQENVTKTQLYRQME